MLSPADLRLVPKLRALGISIPVRCLIAAHATGLPIALAASVLMQESGGGANVWGHDPTLFAGGYDKRNNCAYGPVVTKQAYLAYKAQSGSTGQYGMQGVGACQLTYYSFQDEADRLGGCWKPLANIRVGFAALAHNIRRSGLRAGVTAYNGTGPSADRYADTVLARAKEYAAKLGVPAP